jgi:two-component sensor histidine kinase
VSPIFLNDFSELGEEVERLRVELHRANERYAELRHRVSNELQACMILFSAQRKRSSQPDYCELCVSRICATVALHKALDFGGPEEQASMMDFLPSLSEALKTAFAGRIEFLTLIEPNIVLDQQRAQRVGLVYTESVINALKHGFANEAHGTIETRFRRNGDRLELTIANDGANYKATKKSGNGIRFMRDLAQQLGGTLSLDPLTKGLLVRLSFPD